MEVSSSPTGRACPLEAKAANNCFTFCAQFPHMMRHFPFFELFGLPRGWTFELRLSAFVLVVDEARLRASTAQGDAREGN